MKTFETKHSGSLTDFDSGMVRDTAEGKPRLDLIIPFGTSPTPENIYYYGDVFFALAGLTEITDAERSTMGSILSWYLGGDLGPIHVINGLVRMEGGTEGSYEGSLLKRYGELLARGAKVYAERNWEKANGHAELERFKSSALRHFGQFLMRETDEDHASATVFNVLAGTWLAKKLEGVDGEPSLQQARRRR